MAQSEMAQTQLTQLPAATATSGAGRLSQSLMAMVLGLFVVGMVGFSHIDVLHNAAHDVRHSNAFPCH